MIVDHACHCLLRPARAGCSDHLRSVGVLCSVLLLCGDLVLDCCSMQTYGLQASYIVLQMERLHALLCTKHNSASCAYCCVTACALLPSMWRHEKLLCSVHMLHQWLVKAPTTAPGS
jgi:hypothetical protein